MSKVIFGIILSENHTEMNSITFRLLGPLLLLALVGCASQYDCYPCGKVSCHYCPPKPMPYSNDQSCNCNDSIGRVYLAGLQDAVRPPYDADLVPKSYYQVTDSANQEYDSGVQRQAGKANETVVSRAGSPDRKHVKIQN